MRACALRRPELVETASKVFLVSQRRRASEVREVTPQEAVAALEDEAGFGLQGLRKDAENTRQETLALPASTAINGVA